MKNHQNYVDKIAKNYKTCGQTRVFLHTVFHIKRWFINIQKPFNNNKFKKVLKLNTGIISNMSFQHTKFSLKTTGKIKGSKIHISPLTNTITSYLIYTYNS